MKNIVKIFYKNEKILCYVLVLTLSGLNSPVIAGDTRLSTLAERSGYHKTGQYDEVISLCAAFQKTYPNAVHCIEFGQTPEGRPMKALVVSQSGALTIKQTHRRKLPVLFVQGGIHAGEIDGKDAGFLAVRELLEGKIAKKALEKQVLVFIPVFNVDGHEHFGRWNRPNQRGPEEMGWRTTAENYNLNRDYAKADSVEMQAMLRLINAWDPLVYVDLHVTDGAKFEHDVAIMVEPVHSGDIDLQKAGLSLRTAVIDDLTKQGSLPLPFYPSFIVPDDPASGIADAVATPRFSTGYFPLRNRFAMLVETHSWKNYPTRVHATKNTIIGVISQIANHGADWLKKTQEADKRAAQLSNQSVPLDYGVSDKTRTIEFRGYEYKRTPSEISGALMTRYDETKPQIWHLPFRYEIQPTLQVVAPGGGYLVPVVHAKWVAEKLKQHDILFQSLESSLAQTAVDVFRAEKTTFTNQSYEGHQRLTLQGEWKSENRAISAGSLFVPMAQPKSRLVMALLEPKAPDSFLAWGMFNKNFEQKEYMEDYVAEEVARTQLAEDADLATEFADKLAKDPDFAKNPQARLQFFARRHPSWDERFNLYPVMRIGPRPPGISSPSSLRSADPKSATQ